VLSAEIVRTSRDSRYPSDHFPVAATIRLPAR
jgi:endonuclease/exonuclease/phosphatase family metal-dependent hydrolase